MRCCCRCLVFNSILSSGSSKPNFCISSIFQSDSKCCQHLSNKFFLITFSMSATSAWEIYVTTCRLVACVCFAAETSRWSIGNVMPAVRGPFSLSKAGFNRDSFCTEVSLTSPFLLKSKNQRAKLYKAKFFMTEKIFR